MPKRKRGTQAKAKKDITNVVEFVEEKPKSPKKAAEEVKDTKHGGVERKRAEKFSKKQIPRELDIRAQFPVFGGKTMHLATKEGDVANRVVICSSENVAWRLSRYFDNPTQVIEVHSPRHFVTYTGLFQGVPISVIASGMGEPMIDFTMRETKYFLNGPMAVVRYGTCCSVSDAGEGDVVISTQGAFNVQQDFENQLRFKDNEFYKISDIVSADDELNANLEKYITGNLPDPSLVKTGVCGSSDSFYSSQARYDARFDDRNEYLINQILKKYPKCKTIDMESFCVLATAKMAKKKDVHASAVSIVVRNRMLFGQSATPEKLLETQDLAGYGIMKGLAAYDFPKEEPFDTVKMIKRIKFES